MRHPTRVRLPKGGIRLGESMTTDAVLDTVGTGAELTLYETVVGTIDASPMAGSTATDDRDWFRVDLQAGWEDYLFAAAVTSGLSAPYLGHAAIELRDPNGALVPGTFSDSVAPTFTFTPPVTGTYYLAVSAGTNDTPADPQFFNYTVYVQTKNDWPRPAVVDPFEPYSDTTSKVTREDVVAAAMSYRGRLWAWDNCTGLVWTIATEAGGAFYETISEATGNTSDTIPYVIPDKPYTVPLPGQSYGLWTTTQSSNWALDVQAGDIVRVPYAAGFEHGHSFVVVGGDAQTGWTVIDNTDPAHRSGTPDSVAPVVVQEHRFNEGSALLTASVAYISRLADSSTPLADLQIDSLTPFHPNARPGDTFVAEAVVHNYGSLAAGAFTTRFYLSPDAEFGVRAMQIGADFSTPRLDVGETVTFSQSVTVPSDFDRIGDFHLIVVADCLDEVLELDRGNNSYSTVFTIAPKLIEPKSTLPVSIGGTATVGHGFLWSYDSDEATGEYGNPADITYTVGAPAHGTLLKNGIASNTFTQADIDNGLIRYRQNGDAVGRDGFIFTVTDLAGSQLSEYFSIAVVAGPGPVVDTNKDLHVAAGGAALLELSLSTVALDNQPEELRYRVISAPAHGVLYSKGIAASSFTQADIDNHLVQYRQDGDPGGSDAFTFTVSDRNGIATAVQTFNIAIASEGAPATGTRHVDHEDIGAVVSDGATMMVSQGGSAAASVVEKGGTEIIQNGARAYATIVAGGAQLVQRGGASNCAIVESGGVQQIAAGGIDNGAIIGSGGLQMDAGRSRGATVNGGTQVVQDGGASFGTVLNSGGVQAIASQGVATGSVVNSGGRAVVQSGGTLNGATVHGGVIEVARDGSVGTAAVTFAGTGGMLKLDAGSHFSGTVAGLGYGNYLDLADFAYREGQLLDYRPDSDNSGGKLSLVHGAGAVTIALLGQYVASGFHGTGDGAGGTVITYAEPEAHPASSLFLALPQNA